MRAITLIITALLLRPSCFAATLAEAKEALIKNDFNTARATAKEFTHGKNGEAQYILGCSFSCSGCPKTIGSTEAPDCDDQEARTYFSSAALMGHVRAQSNLGYIYLKGNGTEKNYAEAFKWYSLAARQGDSIAQSNLGGLYQNGWGVKQNDSEAFRWAQKAAKQGNAMAQYNLGGMYYAGRGVKQNIAEARRWYLRAAAQGDDTAQFNLGAMYLKGEGVAKDRVQALEWFRKSSAIGNTEAKEIVQKLEAEANAKK